MGKKKMDERERIRKGVMEKGNEKEGESEEVERGMREKGWRVKKEKGSEVVKGGVGWGRGKWKGVKNEIEDLGCEIWREEERMEGLEDKMERIEKEERGEVMEVEGKEGWEVKGKEREDVEESRRVKKGIGWERDIMGWVSLVVVKRREIGGWERGEGRGYMYK